MNIVLLVDGYEQRRIDKTSVASQNGVDEMSVTTSVRERKTLRLATIPGYEFYRASLAKRLCSEPSPLRPILLVSLE